MAEKAQIFQTLLAGLSFEGVTASGYYAYFYEPGTETLKTIYADRNKTTTAANYYTLNTSGAAEIFGDGVYDVKITTAAGVQKAYWENVALQDINSAPTYQSADYASINAAITAIGSTVGTLVISDSLPASGNFVSPATLSIEVESPGVIAQSTYTGTINGPFKAPSKQVFTGSGIITFGSGAVEVVSPEWWATNTTPGTTNMSAAFNAALVCLLASGGGTLKTIPNQKYRLDATALVDGNNTAVIILDTEGSEFYFYGTGGAFQFLDTEYPVMTGGSIFLDQDTTGTYGLHLKHCRWGELKADIYEGLTKAEAGWATNNRAVYLESGPSDTYDNLYNHISGRARHTGWSVYLDNADTTASRNNANVFNMEYGSTNGIYIAGCEGNHFYGAFECGTGTSISLQDNASGVHSRFNTFEFDWVESASYGAWTPAVDAGCDYNTFILRNHQASVFSIPGNQRMLFNGGGGTNHEPSQIIHSTETYESQINGGHVGGINFLKSTEDFSTGDWTLSTVTVDAGAVALPDGTSASDKNTVTITAANGSIGQAFSIDSASTRFTGSVWLKAATPHVARIQLYSNAGGGEAATRYIYVTTGWKRYYITFEFSSTSGTSLGLFIYPADLGTETGTINVWGAQVNKGYPGAYIANADTTAIRSLSGYGLLASRGGLVAPYLAISALQDTGARINNYRMVACASDLPTSGTYVQGDFLLNTAPAIAANKVLLGWSRLTSGSAHVLNTDWMACYVANS